MIINDISGCCDSNMPEVAAASEVPYVLTFSEQTTATTTLTEEAIDFFVRKTDMLHKAGVKDIIIDPGFGFGKNVKQNWILLRNMQRLRILGKPILAGISRKRMVRHVLNCSEEEALNGTTASNMAALLNGANILRVHNVKQAKETILLFNQMTETD